MQKRSPPFGFLAKRIGELKGAYLGSIKPLLRLSIRYYFIAYNSAIDCG